MHKGFTLVELLAVIVILAIIALIATPIVLGIIDDTKESAQLRSAEMYLKGVSNAVMKENLEQEGNFKPTECIITKDGNLDCDDREGILEVDVDGEKPKNGKITFENGKINDVTLEYETSIIEKNSTGNLIIKNQEVDSGENNEDEIEPEPEEEQEILVTSLNITYNEIDLQWIPTIIINPSEATNKKLEFVLDSYYYNCGNSYSTSGILTFDSTTGNITMVPDTTFRYSGGTIHTYVTVKTTDGSNISNKIKVTLSEGDGWGCLF